MRIICFDAQKKFAFWIDLQQFFQFIKRIKSKKIYSPLFCIVDAGNGLTWMSKENGCGINTELKYLVYFIFTGTIKFTPKSAERTENSCIIICFYRVVGSNERKLFFPQILSIDKLSKIYNMKCIFTIGPCTQFFYVLNRIYISTMQLF